MRFELYELTFPNNKRYFGITNRNTAKRWKQHVATAKRGDKKMRVLSAIRKYGAENVQVKTLVVGPEDYIKDLEIKCIAAYNTTDHAYGYNLALGGQTAPTSSPSVAAKVSASMMGNKNAVGTVCSPETRFLLSESKMGNTWNNGVPKSPEHIAAMLATAKAKRLSDPRYENVSGLVREHGFVQVVHIIAARLSDKSRKEIIAACKAEGIHKTTISVQLAKYYQAKS